VVYNGTLNSNLTISGGLTCIINGTITGDVDQNGGGLFASNATIGGNLKIKGGTFTIENTDVNGNLRIRNTPPGSAQSEVCGTNVKGNLHLKDSDAAVAIGTISASCPGNTIGGNIEVDDNLGPVQIFDDSVGGNLHRKDNAAITGGGDSARSLRGQCAAF
jgi:hypothetical protein